VPDAVVHAMYATNITRRLAHACVTMKASRTDACHVMLKRVQLGNDERPKFSAEALTNLKA
jgi:hypothetical protein